MEPSARPSPAARAAAAAVLESAPPVMRQIRGRMREARGAGVSIPQFRALLFVRRHPGTGLSGVAEHLGTSLPAASELVARLVRNGLVMREADPTSRRRIRLTLSEAGAMHLGGAQAGTLEWLAGRLDGVDPERLDAITAALDELRWLLEDPDADRGRSPTVDEGRARAR
jgi:DNA-binding MarR family transcriptional regulator